LESLNVWTNLVIRAKQAGQTIAEKKVAIPVMKDAPLRLPNIPLPGPLKDFADMVLSSIEQVEVIPVGSTAESLFDNKAFVEGKKNGIAAALDVNPETVIVNGFDVVVEKIQNAGGDSRRQLAAAASEGRRRLQVATEPHRVTTNYQVLAYDDQQAQALTQKTTSTEFQSEVSTYTDATMPPASELGFKHSQIGTAQTTSTQVAPLTARDRPGRNITEALFVPGFGGNSLSGTAGQQSKEEDDDNLELFLVVGGGSILASILGIAITCVVLVKRGSKLAPEWVEDYVERKGV
jgi:hypothetical protein